LTDRAGRALESGKIVYAPALRFELSDREQRFLSPQYLNGKSKNISFHPATGALGGTSCEGGDRQELAAMLRRFHSQAVGFMEALCPIYKDHLTPGLASFRPAEVAGRASSWRKDDTRLHVDAFPSRPNQGRRILRLFTNVNRLSRRRRDSCRACGRRYRGPRGCFSSFESQKAGAHCMTTSCWGFTTR
jgi:hypothetical protein